MPTHPTLHALHEALAQAGAYERDELERLLDLPLGERQAAGVSWPIVTVEESVWAGRDRTMLTLRAPKGATLHDGLGPGDRVMVTVGDRQWTGRIDDAAPTWAEVRVRGYGPDDGEAVVTRLFDSSTWRRYADAIARADGHDSPLRHVLLGELPPSQAQGPPPTLTDSALNASQRSAGLSALQAGELALIHGPPGTGKTRLLVSILQALVAGGDRPWALADSNAAVDHLAERAAQAGLDVVRIGNWGRMSESGRALSVRRRVETGPHAQALRALDRDISRLADRSDRASRAAFGKLMGQRRELRQQAEDAALSGAAVLATTLGTLAWRAAHLPPAHTAVVDEATQALEPAIWTAVPYITRLVLVGDPRQLGPVVQQPNNPLERSLLERLISPTDAEKTVFDAPMLEVQHRMNEHIQALVQPTYGERYVAHASVAQHRLCDLDGVAETDLTRRSTLWIDTAGGGLEEHQDPATRSWANQGEARLVERVVAELLQSGVRPDQIGVITPYSAQSRQLSAALPTVEVASVNAFQGQEREVIICTWVRSNDAGEIGFVADPRRLTVALSRARRLWIGIGDSATLANHRPFADVLDTLAGLGSIQSIWEPPWAE